MLRLASDENFNGDIIRGLLLRQPDLDIVRVQDAALQEAGDPTVLAWAAANHRVLLTHDRKTMPDFAYQRVAEGKHMPGLVVVNNRLPLGRAIDEILLLVQCTLEVEWEGSVFRLPM